MSPTSSRKSVPPLAAWKRPCRVATAPVKAPRTWPNSSDSSRFSGMAPQLMAMNGPLARSDAAVDLPGQHLLAGAGLAADEHRDVGAGHLLDAPEDLAHPRARADELAEARFLELLAQLGALEAQLVQEQRVADDQRRLRGEDGQQLEAALLEAVGDAVVADVEQAEQVALLEQRRAHDAAELEVDHALALAELQVVQRVVDDQRLLVLEHLGDDRIAHAALGVLELQRRPALDVARHAHAHAVALDQDQEALVGVGEGDGGVHHLLEHRLHVVVVHHPLGEAQQRPQRLHLVGVGGGGQPGRRRGRALGELDGEGDAAERDDIPVGEKPLAALLAVQGVVGAAVAGELEVVAVQFQVQRRFGHAGVGEGDVVLGRAADGGDPLDERHGARASVGLLDYQSGHSVVLGLSRIL